MKDESLLGPWVRRFLLEHLVAERNLSRNTQASYRDTLMLLLPFASRQGGGAIDRMTVEALTPAIVRKFLDHLERDRQCSDVTRNQRLATIHSLARFIGMRSPVYLAWCAEIRAVPFKKTAKTVIGYLEKAEMGALLNQPDRRTSLGVRDYALLLFLYNSGARADEAAKLSVGDLQLGASPSVRLHGKGNKLRTCPLWPKTATSLSRLVAERDKSDAVFLSRVNQPLTRFGIHRVVTQYANLASTAMPTLNTKRVSPHTIRHYVASRTISGKFGFGPFFGHISRFTGYIVLTASTTPAWGHEPSTVCRRQANSSATIAEGLVASAHWPIARNHCVSSGIPSPQPAHPFALLSPGKTMLGNWRELRAT